MIPTETLWQERKCFHLMQIYYAKKSEESLQEVYSADALPREISIWFIKQVLSKNIAKRTLNITSILNNFKSLIKRVYQIWCSPEFNKKKFENNYFRAENVQRWKELLTLKRKKQIWLSIIGKFYIFFLKFKF